MGSVLFAGSLAQILTESSMCAVIVDTAMASLGGDGSLETAGPLI